MAYKRFPRAKGTLRPPATSTRCRSLYDARDAIDARPDTLTPSNRQRSILTQFQPQETHIPARNSPKLPLPATPNPITSQTQVTLNRQVKSPCQVKKPAKTYFNPAMQLVIK
jgi:hypothetical protein